MQYPKDQSVDQRNHLPGQYIYFPGSFLGNIYIALVAGKYKKYCAALAFDLPTQSGTYCYNWLHIVTLGYTWLHSVTYDYTGSHMVTIGYIWLHWLIYGYSGLHMVTVCYIALHIVTLLYTWLQ